MTARRCSNCWFAGMTPKDSKPHGPLKTTCMVHGRRIKGGCRAWEEDREEMVAPTARDISAARAVFRASTQEARA